MPGSFPTRAFQWDLARQVERLDVLVELLPQYSEWGYEELYLHLEDAVEYPSLPGIARTDAYSYDDFTRLVEAATRAGIKTVPIVNLLGHTQYLIKAAELRDLNELRGSDGAPLERGQICPLHPQTLEVAEKLLRDLAPFCTAGKVHVGLDESFHLGKCPRCRAEIAQIGLAGHFAGHVQRLHALSQRLGLRMGMWADMLNYLPEIIPQLPTGLAAYDWYYYPFRRHPRVELYNFAESDLAVPLASRGIEYWGCPMNGAFRYEPLPLFRDRLANLRSWWKRCQRVSAKGFLVTSWEAYRLAFEMTTVVDAAAACLWLNPEISDDLGMLRKGFERVFTRKGAKAHARAALACDKYPFSGYSRWEVNQRWDVFAGMRAARLSAREADYFEKLAAKRDLYPEALQASLLFRRYLAQRDAFVRENAGRVFQLRGLLARRRFTQMRNLLETLQTSARGFRKVLEDGAAAAQTMWNRTRDKKVPSQNTALLELDCERLDTWLEWISSCEKDPSLAQGKTIFCGRWQLVFSVHNFAPALQRVSVEERQLDGGWRELHSRYTIEFRGEAARQRASVRRPFSVPIEDPNARLRLVLSGVGQVRISQLLLTDGVTVLYPQNRSSFLLGKKAPHKGFPSIYEVLQTRPLKPFRAVRKKTDPK